MSPLWLVGDSLSLHSQETRIHTATRYGVVTWDHFQLTIGRVVMGPPPWPPPPVESWPESVWFPGLVSEPGWVISSCPVLPESISLARLGPLDTISDTQRKSANCHVAAMLEKIASLVLRQLLHRAVDSVLRSTLDCVVLFHYFPVSPPSLSGLFHFVPTYVHIFNWPEHSGSRTALLFVKDTAFLQQVKLLLMLVSLLPLSIQTS